MKLFETFNPIFLIFTSYAIGVLGTELIKIIGVYKWFENHNYIGDKLTKRLGVLQFGWLIRNSFMGKFNQKLKFKGIFNKEKLDQLKYDMTYAENNHLIGFVLLQVLIGLLLVWGIELWQIVVNTILNIVFNLYLVFLQQFNKRRIDEILKIISSIERSRKANNG